VDGESVGSVEVKTLGDLEGEIVGRGDGRTLGTMLGFDVGVAVVGVNVGDRVAIVGCRDG